MENMNLRSMVLGPVETNVYFVQNRATKEMFLVDPAADPSRIIERINEMQGTLKGILLTHGHFDHIQAVPELKERYQVPVYADGAEIPMLSDPNVNMTGAYGKACAINPDVVLSDGEEFTLAGFAVKTLHTPGHTKGSCCYYLKEEKTLFSGDTLFCRSVGRTDFPGGSTREMMVSLHRLLDELPGDTDVYPGHDEATTISDEKRYNPFV